MAVGRSVMTKPDMSLDMRGGLGVLWGSESHLHSSTYGERIHEDVYRIEDQSTYSDQHQYRDTYTYDATGIVPPPAPYSGTLDGPGPVIANIPESSHRDVLGNSRQVASRRAAILAGSSEWTAVNDIDFAMNSTLYDAWLGPRLCFLPHRAISVVADARVSLNYADVTVNRHETFATSRGPGSEQILQSWDSEATKSKWILGYGVALGVEVKVTENWSVSLLGGYDWMSDDIAVAVGPSTISLDPSGYSLGAQVARSF